MSLITKFITFLSSWIILLTPTNYYVEGVVGQPSSFLPGLSQNETDRTISMLIYRGLFKYNSNGELVEDLAASWEVSEDGLVYTVTLKPDQKWHDGSPILSDDLIYTSFNSPALNGIATDRVDDKTVRFTLPNKYSPFLSLLTVGIMKTGTVENANPLNPIGSGDFSVVSINRSGPLIKEILLYSKNDIEIKKLGFRYYTNDAELEIAGKLGEITGFVSANSHSLENFELYKKPLHGVYYALFFNLKNEDLKKIEVREDLRDTLPLEDLIKDNGILAHGPISKSAYTNEKINFQSLNLLAEKKSLGHKFRLVVPDLPYHVLLAEKIASIWEAQLGIEIELVKVASEKFVADVIEKRDFDILLYGIEVGHDPDRYVYWHSTQAESPNLNFTSFSHVRADRALEEGRNEINMEKRKIHYNEFQEVFKEQVPAIILYHPYMNYYVSDSFTGVSEENIFTVSDRFNAFNSWKISNTK